MNSEQVSKILEKELLKNEAFQNHHGISRTNLHEYIRMPKSIICDLDDGLSSKNEVWIVLQISNNAEEDKVIVYNPTGNDWGVAEFDIKNRKWVMIVVASSLAEALDGM